MYRRTTHTKRFKSNYEARYLFLFIAEVLAQNHTNRNYNKKKMFRVAKTENILASLSTVPFFLS